MNHEASEDGAKIYMSTTGQIAMLVRYITMLENNVCYFYMVEVGLVFKDNCFPINSTIQTLEKVLDSWEYIGDL